ncbi:MAG: DUF5666 domain-containing protein [Pseudomonadota bacterium]
MVLDRRRLLLGSAALALTGCAELPEPLVRDTRPPKEGGIGGTGIIGILTEFGSVIVGGRRVALDGATEVSDVFGPVSQSALVRGHALTVEALGPPEALTAQRIRIDYPLIGPVERVAEDGRSLRVGGVEVVLEPGVSTLAQPGMRAAVSGLWRGRRVIASRVEAPLGEGLDVLAGTWGAGLPALGIQGVAVRSAARPAQGSYVSALGRFEGGAFVAETLQEGRFSEDAPLQRLAVEGYLIARPGAPAGFAISGLGHSFDAASRVSPLAGTRALFVGPYTGEFAVRFGLALPEGTKARRAAIGRAVDVASLPGAVATR